MDGLADKLIETGAEEDVSLYVRDEHAWAEQQIAILKSGPLDQLDRAHLAEYLEDMTIRDRRELGSRMAVLLMHLLKWEFQPEFRSRSWRMTIRTQQTEIADIIEGTPSISTYCDALWLKAFPRAVRDASDETGIAVHNFPKENPWTLQAVLALEPVI